jgi:hypothetical protein
MGWLTVNCSAIMILSWCYNFPITGLWQLFNRMPTQFSIMTVREVHTRVAPMGKFFPFFKNGLWLPTVLLPYPHPSLHPNGLSTSRQLHHIKPVD